MISGKNICLAQGDKGAKKKHATEGTEYTEEFHYPLPRGRVREKGYTNTSLV
jgi:hypothetical protein